MINPVIMQLRIELEQTKKEFQENELKLKRIFYELSNLINPFYKSIQEIKAEEIEQSADELLALKANLLQQQAKIEDIKTQLGG